jgi:hypothetical protein
MADTLHRSRPPASFFVLAVVGLCQTNPGTTYEVPTDKTPAAIVNAQAEVSRARSETIDIRNDVAELQRQLAKPALSYQERQSLIQQIRKLGVLLDESLENERRMQERLVEVANMYTFQLEPNDDISTKIPMPFTTESPMVSARC